MGTMMRGLKRNNKMKKRRTEHAKRKEQIEASKAAKRALVEKMKAFPGIAGITHRRDGNGTVRNV